MNDSQTKSRLEIIRSYFKRVDERDPTFLDLFTDDVEFFFPKFGSARGKAAIAKCGERLAKHLETLEHDIDGFTYIPSGNLIAVEGRESGVTRNGSRWPDGIISQGRFCNVFEFDGLLISRIAIYVDPDFTNDDKDRVKIFRDDNVADDGP
jgi:ketosteroid isomerase-like protein